MRRDFPSSSKAFLTSKRQKPSFGAAWNESGPLVRAIPKRTVADTGAVVTISGLQHAAACIDSDCGYELSVRRTEAIDRLPDFQVVLNIANPACRVVFRVHLSGV